MPGDKAAEPAPVVAGIKWTGDGGSWRARDGEWELRVHAVPGDLGAPGSRAGLRWALHDATRPDTEAGLIEYISGSRVRAMRVAALLIAGWRTADFTAAFGDAYFERAGRLSLLSFLLREQRRNEREGPGAG